MSYGILLLRVIAGTTMAGHGLQKLFGWFGGPGPKGTAEMFRSLGFPAVAAMAVLAGLAETSGLLLAFGFVTPLAALAIAVVMLNAIGSVHWKNGFWNSAGGFEFPLLMLCAVVAVSATGPGRFSLDRLLGWDASISGLWWGVGVLGAALVVSGLTLASRTRPQSQLREADRPQRQREAA